MFQAYMDELELMTGGCCRVHNIQYDHCDTGYSIYRCQNCNKTFREAEDTGCGG